MSSAWLIGFRLQVPTPIGYKGLRLDCAYKADVVVVNLFCPHPLKRIEDGFRPCLAPGVVKQAVLQKAQLLNGR